MSLKLKIFIAFFLLSVLSVVMLGSTLTQIYVGEMMSSMRSTEQKSNDLIMNDIDGFLSGIVNITESFVLDEGIKGMLRQIKEDPSFSKYNDYSRRIYDQLFIYGHNANREIWRICIYADGMPYPYVSTRWVYPTDLDVREKAWYAPLHGGAREVVYGVHTENGVDAITVARPIYQSYTEALLGYISVDIRAADFAEYWQRARRSDAEFPAHYYLYDDKGALVTSSDGEGTEGYARKMLNGSTQYFEIESKSRAYGWRFVMLIPYERLTSKISVITRLVALFFGLTILLSLAFAWVLSNAITRPIQRIYMNMLQFEALRGADGGRGRQVSGVKLKQGFDKMTSQIVAMTEENNRIEKRLRQADLMVRQAQINPHFIYNTLNSIKWMADMQGAKRMVSALDATIRLLRFSAKKDEMLISIQEELDFCKDYMNLVGLKNLDNIDITYDVKLVRPEAYKVPRFILQPILENAIQHGFGARMQGNRIWVEIRREGGLFFIVIRDNGKGMEDAKIAAVMGEDGGEEGSFNRIGIHNVDSRIKYIYGQEYGISITSRVGEFTEVTITLPAQGEGEGEYDPGRNRR